MMSLDKTKYGSKNYFLKFAIFFKGELQHENKQISYERAFRMLENDMYITGIGQAKLQKSSQGITKWGSPSEIFRNLQKYEAHFTENDVTSDKSQFPNIKN